MKMRDFLEVLLVCFLIMENVACDQFLIRLCIPFFCYCIGYLMNKEGDENL